MIIDENDHEYLAKQRYEQRKIKLSKSFFSCAHYFLYPTFFILPKLAKSGHLFRNHQKIVAKDVNSKSLTELTLHTGQKVLWLRHGW